MPLKSLRESLHHPHTLEPPPNGSVCRVVTFPPDATWRRRVGQKEVQAYFDAMGSPGASTWSRDAPHPYMQKTRTLDFCLVIEGEITLVLDTEEVQLERRRHRRAARHQSRVEQPSGEAVRVAFSSHERPSDAVRAMQRSLTRRRSRASALSRRRGQEFPVKPIRVIVGRDPTSSRAFSDRS